MASDTEHVTVLGGRDDVHLVVEGSHNLKLEAVTKQWSNISISDEPTTYHGTSQAEAFLVFPSLTKPRSWLSFISWHWYDQGHWNQSHIISLEDRWLL